MIPKDVPNGLPLVRIISHCMDLIPRDSLLNKELHRLTPIEIVELNKQGEVD